MIKRKLISRRVVLLISKKVSVKTSIHVYNLYLAIFI